MRAAINLLFLAILFALIAVHSYAQFTINMPVERSVFQRVNNRASIQIGGQTDVFLNQIQVKLEVLNGGTAIDWTAINSNVEPGKFRCQIADVQAGWYRMQIKGIVNGAEIGIKVIEKVGVGEVFIISGQSNAQGGRYPDPEFLTEVYYGALDDRVNGVNYSTENSTEIYPLPNIGNILPITDLAPTGKASWCWALLGDKIAQNWNVPVLFFNAAVSATTMETWSLAANNNTSPYIYLKKSLEYYSKIYGVRAILWHQGESDTVYGFDNNPNNAVYYENNLKNLIDKSRTHVNGNLSWVIAKVSRLADSISPGLIQSQENVGITYPNCFVGPFTDDIQPGSAFRDGNVHFRAEGFIDLSNVWFASINTANFINNSQPLAGTNNLEIVANQFVFGSSAAPRLGIIQTILSGNWHDPSIWSSGTVPNSLNEIIIEDGHSITINGKTVYVKNLILNGSIILENNGNIVNCDY